MDEVKRRVRSSAAQARVGFAHHARRCMSYSASRLGCVGVCLFKPL